MDSVDGRWRYGQGKASSPADPETMLAAGDSTEEILREYDFLEPEDIRAYLLFAHRALAGEQVLERTQVRPAG